MVREFKYIVGEQEDSHLYKIFGENMTLYVKRLKDTPGNKKKIKSRRTDLYMMGKCKGGFKYVSALKKVDGSEKELSFDYQGRQYLLSLGKKAAIREM